MMKRIRKTTRNKTMADAEAEAGAAAETERKGTMEASVEEAEAIVVVEEVATVEESMEATATTTMVEEVVAASMLEAEAAEGIMDTITTNTRGINNTVRYTSSNQCLQQFLYPMRIVPNHSSRATTWTATRIKPVAMPTVANGATKCNNGRDQPNLVQRASS